jgi:hypothetical protein
LTGRTPNAERRKDADAAAAKLNPPEDGWRSELAELERRLAGSMTHEEAKLHADNQASVHKEAVKVVQDELKFAEALLITPGLSRCKARRENTTPLEGDSCETCVFSRKVQAVILKLKQAKAKQEQSIKICGNIIVAAKELEQYRPRWVELKKREQTLATARRNIREKKSLRQPQRNSGSTWISPGAMEIEP